MKITNKLNLPKALYDTAVNNVRPLKTDSYSVTEILGSIREIILRKRHYEEIEVDVSELTQAMFGSAVHKMFELNNTEGNAELKMKLNNLTGICDLWHDDVLEDYKTSSVSKVMRKDFEEHKKQALCYCYMILYNYQKKIKKIKINYLMKDWSKIQSRTRTDYPSSPIYVYEYDVQDSDYDYIEEYINKKLKRLSSVTNLKDEELPMCSKKERWNTGDKYAVYKNIGDTKAKKVFNSKDEANKYADENKCSYIDVRPGENIKCLYYCDVYKWCKGDKDGAN